MTGCYTYENVPRVEEIRGFDFTGYSAKGFLFTPYLYHGEYESAGIVEIEMSPAVIVCANTPDTTEYRIFTNERLNKKYAVEIMTADTIIERAYRRCVELGANALTDIKIKAIKTPYKISEGNIQFCYYSYKVSGYAIKRIKNEK